MRSLLAFGFLVQFLLAAIPTLAQNRVLLPLREWTSSEGARLQAELVGFEGDNALLRYEDGRRVTVAEERFSPIDRAELVRARLINLHWENFAESIGTSFFYSYRLPQDRSRKEIATSLAFGPKRFNFSILLLTGKTDLRKFDQIICKDQTGRSFTNPYKPEDIAMYGAEPNLMTRVVLSVMPGRNEAILPILKDLIAAKRVTFFAHSTIGGQTEEIALSPDEIAAMAEMLAVYEKAAPLVREGVIQRAPLQQQTFGAPTAVPAASASTAEAAVAETELAKFKGQRMDSRLGEILWTPPGADPEKVEGLGWIRTSVVVRKKDGTVVAIPFREMDSASKERILAERIKQHSGKEPGESEVWWYHYPKDWDNNQRDFHQAFTFARHKVRDDPQLFARFYTSRFKGALIDHLYIQPVAGGDLIKIPVEGRLTRRYQGSKDMYSILTVRLDPKHAVEILKLINAPKMMVRLSSTANSADIVVADEYWAASREAMALYSWDMDG